MFKNKIAAFVLIVLTVFSTGTLCASAAEVARQDVTATLEETIKATATGNLAGVINPTDGSVSPQLTPGFHIETNINGIRYFILTAQTPSEGTQRSAFFGNGEDGVYIMLSNTATGSTPAADAYTDCEAGASTGANNANVIAYLVENAQVEVPEMGLITEYDETRGGYLLGVVDFPPSLSFPGGGGIKLAFATNPKTGTFSSDDEPGEYRATLILTTIVP